MMIAVILTNSHTTLSIWYSMILIDVVHSNSIKHLLSESNPNHLIYLMNSFLIEMRIE